MMRNGLFTLLVFTDPQFISACLSSLILVALLVVKPYCFQVGSTPFVPSLNLLTSYALSSYVFLRTISLSLQRSLLHESVITLSLKLLTR